MFPLGLIFRLFPFVILSALSTRSYSFVLPCPSAPNYAAECSRRFFFFFRPLPLQLQIPDDTEGGYLWRGPRPPFFNLLDGGGRAPPLIFFVFPPFRRSCCDLAFFETHTALQLVRFVKPFFPFQPFFGYFSFPSTGRDRSALLSPTLSNDLPFFTGPIAWIQLAEVGTEASPSRFFPLKPFRSRSA